MSLFKFTVVCVAALAICGCDRGQPTAPGQATSAVTAADFAATKKDAESGDAEAQYNLGLMYDNGEGVPQDNAEAVKWYRLAADQGKALGQLNLGVMYYNGEGVPKDLVEAYAWFFVSSTWGYKLAAKTQGRIKERLTAEQLAVAQKRANELSGKYGGGK